MNFSDIDFSALGRMMDNMSPEEKEKLNKYAQNMMDNMKQQAPQEEEEEQTFYEYLDIEEDDYNHLPGRVLECLESASDLEEYYEDVPEADFSASVLFYGKAILSMLRTYHYPIYRDVLSYNGFSNPNTTTIYSYLFPLMNDDNVQTLINEGIGTIYEWDSHKLALQQLYTFFNRAEFDFITREDLEKLKYLLFEEEVLLNIEKLV